MTNINNYNKITKTLAIVVILIISSISYNILLNEPLIKETTASLTPSSGWKYVRQINISGSLADYQIKLRLYKNDSTKDNPTNYTIDLAGHCLNFPNDIRFGTTSDPSTATMLPQWIETETVDYVDIWVKLPNPTQSSIYLFVGNSVATKYSNGSATFIFFDALNNITNFNANWTKVSGDDATLDTTTFSKPMIKLPDTSTLTFTEYKRYVSLPTTYDFVIHVDMASDANQYTQIRTKDASDNKIAYTLLNRGSYNSHCLVADDYYNFGTYSVNQVLSFDTYFDPVNHQVLKVVCSDGTSYTTPVNYYTASDVSQITILGLGSSATGNSWFSNIYVRKYNDPEPYLSSYGTWQIVEQLTSWQYYKQINISNHITDYQLRFHIINATGTDDPANFTIYTNGYSKNFPYDIRFGTTNNPDTATMLPQWLEQYNDTDAIYWVNISTYTTIYLFTGNQNASEYSDGDATFIFFDDFSGTSLNTSKWTVYDGSPSIDPSGYLVLNCNDGGSDKVHSNTYFSTGVRVKMKIYYEDTHSIGLVEETAGNLDFNGDVATFDTYSATGHPRVDIEDEGGNNHLDLITVNKDTWNIDEILWTSSSLSILENGVEFYSGMPYTTGIPDGTPSIPIYFYVYYLDSSPLLKVDWIFVGKYSDTEPTISTGSWQNVGGGTTNSPPSISSIYPSNGSTNIELQPTCSITISDPDGDFMNISWYENTTGIWKLQQTNSSKPDGTYYWHFVNATGYSTTFYWKVVVDDGNHTVTAIYHFTTKQKPIFSEPSYIINNSSRHFGFPSAVKCMNGDIILVYRNGTSHSGDNAKIEYLRSNDNGLTWNYGGVILDTAYDDRNPDMCVAPNGDLILVVDIYSSTSGHLGAYLLRSTDNGSTWTNYGSVYNNITNEDSGDLFYYTTQFHVVGNTIYMISIEKDANGTLFNAFYKSEDDGNTWTRLSKVSTGTQSNEAGFEFVGNNTFVTIIRDRSTTRDHTWLTKSTDGGYTWSTPTDISSTVGYIHRPKIYWFNSTRLICVCRNATDNPTSGYPAYFSILYSDDNGNTWNNWTNVQYYPRDGGYGTLIKNPSGNNSDLLIWYSDAEPSTYGYPDLWSSWLFNGTDYYPSTPNYPPSISNPYPADGSTNVPVNTTLSVDIYDQNGDSVNVTFNIGNSESFYDFKQLYLPLKSISYNGSTYFAFINSSGNIIIIKYNKNYTWEYHIISPPTLLSNAHGSPSITVDVNGYIHVVWGDGYYDGSSIYYVKSLNPEDISSFTTPVSLSTSSYSAYPLVLSLGNGDLIFVYRDGNYGQYWKIRKSTDGGSTWSAETTILDFGTYRPYVYMFTDGTNIYWGISYHDSTSDHQRNLYLIYSDDEGATWYEMGSSTALTLPISYSDLTPIITSDATEVYGGQVYNGNPYLICESAGYYKLAYWDGSSWQVKTIVADGSGTTAFKGQGASLHVDATGIYAYLPIYENSHYNIKEYKSTDGGVTWTKTADITSSTTYDYCYPFVPINMSSVKLVFMENDGGTYAGDPRTWEDTNNPYIYDVSTNNLGFQYVAGNSIVVGSGTASISVTLDYNTRYDWFVTADDGVDVNISNTWYFITQSQSLLVDISCSPTTWTISGNPLTGTSVNTTSAYFTIWNNGTTNVTVKIAVNNSANWIYCNWTTYKTTSNLNYFTCNFTTDGENWTNIEIKDGNEPVTVLFSNLQAGTNDTFGIKLWIPRYLSTTSQQQFEIYIKAY